MKRKSFQEWVNTTIKKTAILYEVNEFSDRVVLDTDPKELEGRRNWKKHILAARLENPGVYAVKKWPPETELSQDAMIKTTPGAIYVAFKNDFDEQDIKANIKSVAGRDVVKITREPYFSFGVKRSDDVEGSKATTNIKTPHSSKWQDIEALTDVGNVYKIEVAPGREQIVSRRINKLLGTAGQKIIQHHTPASRVLAYKWVKGYNPNNTEKEGVWRWHWAKEGYTSGAEVPEDFATKMETEGEVLPKPQKDVYWIEYQNGVRGERAHPSKWEEFEKLWKQQNALTAIERDYQYSIPAQNKEGDWKTFEKLLTAEPSPRMSVEQHPLYICPVCKKEVIAVPATKTSSGVFASKTKEGHYISNAGNFISPQSYHANPIGYNVVQRGSCGHHFFLKTPKKIGKNLETLLKSQFGGVVPQAAEPTINPTRIQMGSGAEVSPEQQQLLQRQDILRTKGYQGYKEQD